MEENTKRIKKLFKHMKEFSKESNKLELALRKMDWPMELFFVTLTNEIIKELLKINTDDQNIKTHKRISSNISNNNIYIEKSGKTYIYQMINLYEEIKTYKKNIPDDYILYIITPENIQNTLKILMATNRIISSNPNVIKERNEFNSYIMNFLINIINLNNKILINVLSTQSQYNAFYQLFILFSKNDEHRSLLYELERNILLYYPDSNNLKELINYTIDCIDEELNKNNCKKIISEIKKILYIYKNEIKIINKIMMKLIIKIFSLFEDEIGKHYFINDFLKFCFNEISFDGNNKFYSRYIFSSSLKSKTLVIRNSNTSNDKQIDSRKTELFLDENKNNKNILNKDSINSSNANINNFIRGNTITFKDAHDIEKQINQINNNNKENENNKIINDKEDNNNNLNLNKSKSINVEQRNDNTYNKEFLNFLFDIYNEFINLKMKNSYNFFFSELFLSINNSYEGKNEYSFLIKNTNYSQIILSSLYKLKDESLIGAYFSKIMSLSIPNDKKEFDNKENECYIPEFDLTFIINNIKLFLETEQISIVISSQIINLMKMNNKIIDIILNKCNIFEIFLSVLNDENYKNEIKKRIIELLENILKTNNNKIEYSLQIPIISYNITDNALITKLYIISLVYENKVSELNSKIVLIVNYMTSLYDQKKIQELIIFFDILLEGICKNILKIPNYKIIDEETINKINIILFDIANIKNNELIINYKNYEDLFLILLKFQYNYNKKHIIYYLNKISIYNKNKLIIEEDLIYMILKNFLVNENDYNTKIYLLNNIFIYCLDIKDNIDKMNINTPENNNNSSNDYYLLKAPNILIKIINILYDIKDYQCLDFLISKLIILMKNSLLNIKILINNNNFIQIIIKILISLYQDKKEENLSIKLNMLLNDLSKYLSEKILFQYLNEIYFIFYTTISPKETEKDNHKEENKEIILELFNILKNGIINSRKNNYDYLSISNYCFYNPFIFNLFYIKEIKFDESIYNFLCINMNIRISTFNNIGNFHLIEFSNKDKGNLLTISINNDKKLIIKENISKMKNKKENKIEIPKINEIINDDGNFHTILIIIDIKAKNIYFKIDQEKIELSDKNNYKSKYNFFEFTKFDILIGYKPSILKSKLNSNKNLSNAPIIDIKNLLVTKFNNMEEFNSIIDRKNGIFKNEILTENINKNRKYLDKNNNDNLIENTIIADINFKNKNINIIKSNKIRNELEKLNEFLTNDSLNCKYISYYNIYSPSNKNSINNRQIKVYMLSLINNIEEFYSINNSNNNIVFNINQKYIKEKIYDNYNTSFSACNYFFIDYLFSFFFDIEKRRKIINKDNNNEEIQNNKNEITPNDTKSETPLAKPLFENSFLNDCLLIIFEIIVELPKKEIIDYFLYNNSNISTKLKIFFLRNNYLFNDNDFFQKLFQVLSADEKSSVLEEEISYSQQILLVILSEIFLDILIFQKLNIYSQNIILIKLSQLLFNNNNLKYESNLNKILYTLLEKLYNITLYYELSSKQINYSLDEENNNPLQIDFIEKCINSLFNIIQTNKNKELEEKIDELNYYIYNLYLNFDENKQNHNIKNFIEEYKTYFDYNFLNNDCINNQLQKLMNLISKYEMNKTGSKNNSFEIVYKKDLNNNENKICYFCLYINNYFYIKLENVYNNIKFDKIMDNNYINIFLNFESYREILGINNFAWFLSRNESNHKIQNKFLLKKNDIKRKSEMKKRLKGETYTYEYIYDKEKYKITIKSLFEIFLLDKISNDNNLVNAIIEKENKELNINNSNTIENCLYIKTIHKTLSVMILLKEYILILTNICIDNNKNLNVVKSEIDGTIWCLQKEEYESELEKYISKNEKNIIKELFTIDAENHKNNKMQIKGFGYNNTFKFSFKKLYYKNISEMHRTSYLTVPNSIEIFMSNGKSYFLCLNITKREKIFMEIINNINEVYKNKEKRLEGYTDSFLKKTSKNVCFENFYMKYCPIGYIENNIKEYSNTGLFGLKKSARKKTSSVHVINANLYISNLKNNFTEAIINEYTFRSEVIDLWAKNRISNYDYIMLLNILSGRSLNNLSQYFIFPRIFNDFNHNILNWISSSIYRDLSYPILASEPSLREDIKNKYDITEADKYHSGTFYSTYAFISYFLIRQRPFSEISLEIQGGEFDATDRLFIGSKEVCGMKEKYQESIPPLMTLPELYINFNKFYFGKTQKDEFLVNDFILPNWSREDPRKFSLVIKRIFESRNINAKLNKWIDIIFGIAQSGPEAVKLLNTYRKACYALSLDEIEEFKKKFELLGMLIEKQELGYNAKQIFNKPHKKKENWNEYKEHENMFFDTNLKLRKIKFIKINNNEYDKEKNNIIFNSINDFLIDIDNEYIKNTNINNNCQGGIASLKSIITALSENNINYFNQKYNNPLKIINILEKENKFIILGNGYHFLGKNYDFILCYKNKYLEIMNLKLDIYYSFYLNESDDISTLVTNDKGNKIYIAFNNSNIIEYKIHFLEEEEYINEIKKKKDNMIYPCIKSNALDKLSLKYNNYYIYNFNEEIFDKSITSLKRSETKKYKKKLKLPKISSPAIITLQKNMENNFTFSNPHIPEKIVKIKLNEEHKILIALTVSNIIYIISLNNNYKLMHILTYYKKYKYQYKIKDIISLPNNGDFLIYSSLTVHLFSINGVPLCELNLLEKVHESISKITYCLAIFLYDVILFTGHEDNSIIIWKVKNKNTLQNFNERVSYVYNNNKAKSFLNEYYYNYDFDLNDNNYNYNIQECELRRKFEIVSQIKMEENLNNISIDFMKMSQDMSYMIILDNKKNIYILSNFDDYKEENISSNNGSSTNLNMNNNTGVFGYFKDKKKIYCISCCKEVGDNYYRASRVQSLSNIQTDSNDITNNSITCEEDLYSTKVDDTVSCSSNLENSEKEETKNNNKETKDTNYICEECKLKLINTESYLYNY